jgi:hypothetical protein
LNFLVHTWIKNLKRVKCKNYFHFEYPFSDHFAGPRTGPVPPALLPRHGAGTEFSEKFEFLATANIKVTIFSDVTPCGAVEM